jgi:hypothetical protein
MADRDAARPANSNLARDLMASRAHSDLKVAPRLFRVAEPGDAPQTRTPPMAGLFGWGTRIRT